MTLFDFVLCTASMLLGFSIGAIILLVKDKKNNNKTN